jgi:hypothetical protein
MNSRSERLDLPEAFAAYYYFIDLDNNAIVPYEYFNIGHKIVDLDLLVKTLSQNHVAEGVCPPPYCKNTFDMFWRRIGYLVFATDAPGVLNETAIRFSEVGTGKDGDHTFHYIGPSEVTVQVEGVDQKIYAVVFFNEMMKRKSLLSKSRPLKAKESESFKFQFPFDRHKPRIDDSGGTNMGPPVPPPGRRR